MRNPKRPEKAKQFSDEDMLALLRENHMLKTAQAAQFDMMLKHDPASATLAAPTLQGPFGGWGGQYGIFTQPGGRPDTLSTLVRPMGLAGLIPVAPSEYEQEDLDIMTGVTDGAGSNATTWAGDPPVAGQAKSARLRWEFGKWYMKTKLNALPEIGALKNRADVPHKILNAGPMSNPYVPDLMWRLDDTRSQMRYELWLLGVELQRGLEKVIWNGNINTASSSTRRGWMKEFEGLDRIIKTSYTDINGNSVPALDSIVENFNADVGATIAGGDGRNIVQIVHDIAYALMQRASAMGMEGTTFRITMRQEAFRSVVESYACNYATYRCASSATATVPLNNDARDVNDLRLEMMNGQYLLVDGRPWPVVFSEGITQEVLANATYMSDIYFTPVEWNGLPLHRMEHFNMGNTYSREFAEFSGVDTLVINNGMFLAGKRSTGFAMEYLFGAMMRQVMEATFLCARLDNVQYVYRAKTRNAYPGDSFYANGGATYWSD